MKNIKNILIFRIGNLGDIVCSMPAMVAIRKHYPDAWIGLLTYKELKMAPDAEKILEGADYLDEIITYDTTRIRDLKYLLSINKKMRSLKVDLLIYLSLSKGTRWRLIRDWFFFRMAGCKRLIGYKLPKPISFQVQNGLKIPIYMQEVDRLLGLLSPLGIDALRVDFKLPIDEIVKNNIERIWGRFDLNKGQIVIGVCPGAKFQAKRWDINKFTEVISKLSEKYGARFVLIGGPGEEKDGIQISDKCGDAIVNMIGKTSYMESAEAIRRCRLFVANDCGPVHLASAVGTPVVAIYSSQDYPGAWHPWGTNHTVLRNDKVSCRFCFRTECETKDCINGITVDDVLEACRKYLEPSHT
jgi:ADP-heptose:LPS heptosyltransferase